MMEQYALSLESPPIAGSENSCDDSCSILVFVGFCERPEQIFYFVFGKA